ncbi:hypothetical protein [Phreatobacter oligotrophus]|uniref:Uncharacterized protein n=1 Tax=Phreatobacter oligotrophus TaxID=1122261 RepID=A0A2T4YYB6_9HYPH|nr:hypothetical protein [Phreatobacter oligotrophus]PTM51501.1 hypothetical protein C8P69_110169 [Phreatobacter oligotrophus]
MTLQSPLTIKRNSPLVRKLIDDAAEAIKGPLLINLVEQFAGDVDPEDIPDGEKATPRSRLEDCLALTHYEGSSLDFLGRALHAVWLDPAIRNALLREEPIFARPVPTGVFVRTVQELRDGLSTLDGKIATEPAFRRKLINTGGHLQKLAQLLRTICAAKRLHSELLRLQSASADQLDKREQLIVRATTPKVAIDAVLTVAAAVRKDLPGSTRTTLEPRLAELAATSAGRDAAPGALATQRLTVAIRDLLEGGLGLIVDDVMKATEAITYRSLIEVISINADRSLHWPIYLVSVMWRQAVFSLGIWRETVEELLELLKQCEAFRSNGTRPDWGTLYKIEDYLDLLTRGNAGGDNGIRDLIGEVKDAATAFDNVLDLDAGDPALETEAIDQLEAACHELVEEVRLQRLLADKPIEEFVTAFSRLIPVVATLSTTVRRI